ncbi:MAG: glycosyltransferase [Acidobacteriaceae bacterium]
MSDQHPRVAFFPDAFHEVDGVAIVARNFAAYARESNIPLLIVHAGPSDQVVQEGSVTRIEVRRSPIKFPLDRNHEFDLILLRRYRKVAAQLDEFKPDLIQITGPSDIGILGAMCAHKMQIPLSAFWQTNLPQYAGLRTAQALKFLPRRAAGYISRRTQQLSHRATTRFYKIPRILFAPNPEIVQMLADTTGKPCFPMGHGVDTNRFSPAFRDSIGAPFTIGYVGRLTAEKNVRWLARLEQALLAKGLRDFRILIVGHGAEQEWLGQHMHHAEFLGVLRGEELSRAFANMDVLAFPSETETFGLVVLEALASGVSVVAMATGGPKYTVEHGKTGFIAGNFDEFASHVASLMTNPEMVTRMRGEGRRHAHENSWAHAFQNIYETYRSYLDGAKATARNNYPRSLNDSVPAQPLC